ncbi:hypothetical protein [Nocardia camponoti]|uniref:Uncharacterized protein n=1 Tax=Nocardia camponoti TaxID=1616106 RepID=A0A917V4Y8_9NOCA|nr:hypothetical protein [Nocardia camponoti]GGK38096.1 hypothetical protein GCM10011591_07160 [Nocardia camponoti]
MASGKHRAVSAQRQKVGSVVVAGAVPLVLALIGTGTASADPGQQPTVSQPETPEIDMSAPAGPVIPANTRSSLAWSRSGPESRYLSPVGPLHAPTAAAPVAPILPPPGQFRFGDQQVPVPEWVPVDTSIQINDVSAQTEAQLATFLDSVGLERSRSDLVAASTIGSAARGAAVGSTLAMPVAMMSSTIGAVAGLVAGVPLLPIGLVAGPILGGMVGYMAVSVPASIIGAGIGAAVGAAGGMIAPSHGVSPEGVAPVAADVAPALA